MEKLPHHYAHYQETAQVEAFQIMYAALQKRVSKAGSLFVKHPQIIYHLQIASNFIMTAEIKVS
jgi:hypothetical protein